MAENDGVAACSETQSELAQNRSSTAGAARTISGALVT